jgi:16S rRNA (cytidine1402-2'-O)-methyltransferase
VNRSRRPKAVPNASQTIAERDDRPAGTLFVVSTPIGNLGDMTHRAVGVLESVALVLCEDTRHSRTLLDHYGLSTPVSALHEHNEAREIPRVLSRLLAGDDVGLITDAGTPLLSDPGERLVRAAIESGLRVSPIPGASALLAALVVSGLPTEAFTFVGFLPRKGADRSGRIAFLSELTHTSVFYEAPGRVAKTLGDLEAAGCATRRAVVARELTKQFEEVRRGTVGELHEYYRESPPRGEVAIVMEGRAEAVVDEALLRDQARALRAQGASTREIVRALVEQYGSARNLAYRLAQDP